jgi:serine/threonine protein kinase
MRTIADRLASPTGVLIAMPLLILLSAGGVLAIADGLARRSAREQAELVFATAGRNAAQRTREILGQAGPVLDGLRAWLATGSAEHAGMAHTLRALTASRPGIVRAHVGWPDGRLAGLERIDGGWSLLELEPISRGARTLRRALSADGGLAEAVAGERPDFDVRKRPWWRTAVDRGTRSWGEPYLFAGPERPGISCSEPILDHEGRVKAVVSVDFELASLGEAYTSGGKVMHVLFDAERTLIGLPESWTTQLPGDRLLRPSDFHLPVLSDLFTSLAQLPAPGTPISLAWQVGGTGYGALVQAIPINGGPTWYLAQIIPDALLTGRIDKARRLSLLLGGVAVLLGFGLSAWFARNLGRSRREAEAQRARAIAAESQVRHLGAYRLVRKLGAGGMGEVWLGMHRMLARPAAIKRITAARLTGGDADRIAEARTRFATEARITASLRSRNTIELFDYGTTADGGFYYVMELLDGMDLRALVEQHGQLPVGRVIHLLLQACSSLAEAHDRGLVHRDIKPENIYTCRRADEVDVVKVLDFGIVAVQDRDVGVTKRGFVVGTPSTMSPEQARGEPLDGRSDLYALGCVAYWLLTGTEVFRLDGQMELILAHLNDQPEAPSFRAGRTLPDGLNELVLACLAKSRESRPADARALATALRAIVIPAGEAWDAGRAAAWWKEHMPPTPDAAIDDRQDRSTEFTH